MQGTEKGRSAGKKMRLTKHPNRRSTQILLSDAAATPLRRRIKSPPKKNRKGAGAGSQSGAHGNPARYTSGLPIAGVHKYPERPQSGDPANGKGREK